MKIIKDFKIDLRNMSANQQAREFSVIGDNNCIFTLEVKNEDDHYYNFDTKTFSSTQARLYRARIINGKYDGSITFPTISDNDHYDIYLFAEHGLDTFHTERQEVRFLDNTIDINSSRGSNSSLLQKIIYQYTDTTITIGGKSPNLEAVFTSVVLGNASIVVPRGQKVTSIPFECTVTVATNKAVYIKSQPTTNDLFAQVTRTFNADPIDITGEDIYPTATDAFTGDDINGAITSGSVVRMDNTDLSAVIKVGDKITSPVTTDTVNGDFSGGATAITMDAAVATKMAVGDRVTGSAALNAGIFLVDSIDSTNVFSLNASAAIDDGTTLTFSSKVNRSLTTVTVVETSGTATDFTMSQAIQFRDNQPLTFFNRMNHRWSLASAGTVGIAEGVAAINSTYITPGSIISPYSSKDTITDILEDDFGGLFKRTRIVNQVNVPAIYTTGYDATVTEGVIARRPGEIVFNKQQPLALGGQSINFHGYGTAGIGAVTNGLVVELTNLSIALTKPTTTTSAAVNNSTAITVSSLQGVINNVSQISGIGINPLVADPYITSGGGATGGGTWTADAVQTLENGITLTVENTARIATIKGNISISNVYVGSLNLYFDLERLLSA